MTNLLVYSQNGEELLQSFRNDKISIKCYRIPDTCYYNDFMMIYVLNGDDCKFCYFEDMDDMFTIYDSMVKLYSIYEINDKLNK